MNKAEELNTEISKLEAQPLTYATAEKLAMLYTVRDHISPKETIKTTAENNISEWGDSDFLSAISGKSAGEIWVTVDELVSSVRAIYPKLYDAFMAKLS